MLQSSVHVQVFEDGTLKLSRRAYILEQLGLEDEGRAQLEVQGPKTGDVLRYVLAQSRSLPRQFFFGPTKCLRNAQGLVIVP